MIVELIMLVMILIVIFFVWKNYFKTKKMILKAEQALFPEPSSLTDVTKGESSTNETPPNHKNIMTKRGEAYPLTLKSKNWRTKKWFIITASIMILTIILMVTMTDTLFEWSNLMPFLPIFLMSIFTAVVPSFLALDEGIYIDEKYYDWSRIKAFKIKPMTIKSEGYGLFEDSPSYTEVEFILDLSDKPKTSSIYIYDKQDVERLKNILQKKIRHDEKSNTVQ